MNNRVKTKRLTKKRAKELLTSIFGKSPEVKPTADHAPEVWAGNMGSTAFEMYKVNNGKTVILHIQFSGCEFAKLYYDADTFEYDFNFANSQLQATARSQAFDYMASCGYAVVTCADAEKHNLRTITE